MLSRALQMAKPAMQQLEGNDKSYNRALHYLPCVFNTMQHQQQVKGWVLHHSMESECYKKEHGEIMRALQSYAYTQNTMLGYQSPISLDQLHSLVLPPELYDSLYQPQPMMPSVDNPCQEQLLENDNEDKMIPAATLGCSAMAVHMRKFAATSMEQENETDWDSEYDHPPPKLQPAGMSDQEEWGDDDQINLGDHLAVAHESPVIEYDHI